MKKLKKVSVAHLTSAHAPNDTRIFLKECRTLADSGYDVSLIAQGDGDSEADSVHMRSVPRPKTRSERMLRTMYRVYKRAVDLDADIYHFHDPELVFAGMLLKLRGKQVIYDMHEDLPKQILTKEWIPAPMRRLISTATHGLESVYPYIFDRIVTATPAIARKFPQGSTEVVQNFPLLEEFEAAIDVPYAERPHAVAYVGGISELRGVRQMVESLAALAPDTRLLLAGGFGPASLLKEVQALPGWDRVEYRGQQSRQEVRDLLAQSRAGLVLFHDAPNHVEAQPNKLFEYMSAGLPVISSNFPLWRELIEGERVGLVVDPLDTRAITEAIRWIFAHPTEAEAMGRRGRELVMNRINWQAESRKLLGVYQDLRGGETR